MQQGSKKSSQSAVSGNLRPNALDSGALTPLSYTLSERPRGKRPAPRIVLQLRGRRQAPRPSRPTVRIKAQRAHMGTKVEIKGVQTPGLVIRDMVAPDARSLARYMLREEYQATIAVRYETAADVQKFVARCLRRQASLTRSVFHLSAELKASNEVVGDGFIIMNRPKTFEIGWGVHPELWGRGFGTEIGRALMAIAFEKLGATTVWAKSFASNTASLRVCEKLGMTEDRVSKNHPVAPGFRTDVSFRSISADTYFDAPY